MTTDSSPNVAPADGDSPRRRDLRESRSRALGHDEVALPLVERERLFELRPRIPRETVQPPSSVPPTVGKQLVARVSLAHHLPVRAELPSGTVTFLFTDVEGSTKLLHELGPERYAEALAEHRNVLREAFERHGGVEVDTQGDAFFVAFPTAPGALAAAREAQEALQIPVRMGIHTGTPLLTEEGYVGPDVHRAARIAAAGHGGQVLVSSATTALLAGDGLRDLGQHRLKDLSAPERMYQLGAGDFPPLKTLYQTNLPVPTTP